MSYCTRIDMNDASATSGWKPLFNKEQDDPNVREVIASMGGQAVVNANRARSESK